MKTWSSSTEPGNETRFGTPDIVLVDRDERHDLDVDVSGRAGAGVGADEEPATSLCSRGHGVVSATTLHGRRAKTSGAASASIANAKK